MPSFNPKKYQSSVLESIEKYFRACYQEGNANTAFYKTTLELWNKGIQYNPIAGFPAEMPYFCLRIPTGGGKTWLAAKAVQLVNTHLLRSEYSLILWLVPSNAIREQTLKALKERDHPYHLALREAGPITVLDLEEAKNVTCATLDTSTTVIVTTRQAFQVGDTELRKVYESSGALMHHFDNLRPEQKAALLNDDGVTPYSLANVLRLRRPFIIVDEAHNSRTPLSFETLSRFRPSGIMELTATPDTEVTPSNVLHSVYAAELKGEEMIKLPIRLETEPNWQQCLADAIARRDELQTLAAQEMRKGADYLRPIVLIQGQARSQKHETLHVDKVKEELINNHRIPAEEIIIATGEEKGLEKIEADYKGGILSSDCPVKFVITQQALAEGWDCPFAYVLVSMAEIRSSIAVEQLLGRILRQPGAKHFEHNVLNQSYAFVVSSDFQATASGLRDRLVEGAGFERKEVSEFVVALKPEQGKMDYQNYAGRAVIRLIVIEIPEEPELKKISKPTKDKISWNKKENKLTISAPLTPEETEELAATVSCETIKEAIKRAGEASRTKAIEFFEPPADLGKRLDVPQMAIRIQGELKLFDDPEVLDYPWDLSTYDAQPSREELEALEYTTKISSGGEIDIDEETGKVKTTFIVDLQRDLGFAYTPEHWNEVRLAAWLCKNLPKVTVTHDKKLAFVSGWLSRLLQMDVVDLGRVNRQKFQIRTLLENRIQELQQKAIDEAYQQVLFSDDAKNRIVVDSSFPYSFHQYAYAPNNDYNGEYGPYDFRHHYYSRIGDFDTKEEFECAVWLDQQAEKGKIEYWVRNLVRKEGCSFSFQKADGKFYPDFVCKLPSGVILVVEYKGADRWDTPKVKADRMIGELWAEMSEGKCRFVMVKDKKWVGIQNKLNEK